MQLYLLRHADADTIAATDEERRLSEKGIEQAHKVGRFCEENDLAVSLILASPVLRAQETASIVSQHLRTELLIAPWLACGMTPEMAYAELAAFRSQRSVMIVGHEPDFSQLIANLLAASSHSQVHVRKASLTLLEVPVLRAGAGLLEFSIPCRLM